ncbi:MAG: beta-ketoacyl-ACP synthase III [Candidatus Bipolaricaulota bacterium]
MRVRVAGTGAYLPPQRVTNVQLSERVDTSDEWIQSRTGIRERRLLGPGDVPSHMGVSAAQAALAAAGRTPAEVGLLMVASNVLEQPVPGTAPFVAQGLGFPDDVPFMDIMAGCSGFVFGMAAAGSLVTCGVVRSALLVGTEALSRFVDWQDRATCVLFGDGAGAVLLEHSAEEQGILGVSLHGDPSKTHLLRVEVGGVRLPADELSVRARRHFLKMEGEGVFRSAVHMMERSSREALAQAQLSPEDVDWWIPHQANLRIIDALARRLAVPKERMVINIDRVANTSTASIPIALDELARNGRIQPGHILALTAFGAGASYGTVIVRW